MTAIVAAPFRDRATWRAYVAGEEYTGTDARISELAAAGLVEASGADGGEDLSALTVARLRALCDERCVEYPRKATKAQLIALLGE